MKKILALLLVVVMVFAMTACGAKEATGDDIKIALEAQRIHIFDKDTEKCICH